ncbi:cell division protein Fic [Shewanella hanedai]|uniref:Fic family protein n=1 Tax=Shewanella hanedai TaxID=25 RepID=A0A553JUS3_SHEHA|nr:Fic family protein [Shewanella hanedai]TRY16202.1 Fic family protein [Shewanella hanedai]GGI67129.1 cell division protein Fic [Shewanella hanedai]
MWIWQLKDWPNFTYDKTIVIPKLESCIQAVSPLKQLSEFLSLEQRLDWEAAILLDETLASAKIEGELYDRDSVRSSIVNKLGIGKGNKFNQQSDAMVELLLSAIRTTEQQVNHDVIKQWHQMLFPVAPIITPMTIGDYRDDTMQIVSGRYGKQQVHFEAPGAVNSEVEQEMELFFDWLNASSNESTFIRAAIAKFWFVTIHPFDDGNGRLSRIIAERCLAEAEHINLRLFSLSSAFESHRNEYYQLLESHQRCELGSNEKIVDEKNNLDLTAWIVWFLSMLEIAAIDAKKEFERVMQTTRFWQKNQLTVFNTRQRKVITKLLETTDFSEGISRKKYKALAKTTDATAARDIGDLVEKEILVPIGEGRSRRYLIQKS